MHTTLLGSMPQHLKPTTVQAGLNAVALHYQHIPREKHHISSSHLGLIKSQCSMSSAHLKLSASYLGSCTLVHSNLHSAPGASHRILTAKLLELAMNRHRINTASHRGHCLTEQQSSTHSRLAHRGSQGLQTAMLTGHSEPLTRSKSLCSQRAPLAHTATAHNAHHIALTEALRALCINRCSKAFIAEQHTWTALTQMLYSRGSTVAGQVGPLLS